MKQIVMSKAAWQSWTLIFNGLALAALVLEAATAANLPFVGTEYFAFAVALVNGLLRFRSKLPVTAKGHDPVEVGE